MIPTHLDLVLGRHRGPRHSVIGPRLLRRRCPLLTLALCTVLCGCSSFYERWAQHDGEAILDEKRSAVEQFRRHQLLDPEQHLGATAPKESPVEVPKILTLLDAVTIATQHNREYERRREQLFLTSLDLGLTRRDFYLPIFSGTLGYAQSDGRERDFNEGMSLSLGATQFLYTGGVIDLDGSAALDRVGRQGSNQTSSISGGVTLTQPLLQGFGHTIAFEGLTQAERSALYEARDFELFRQDFVIDIINDYYNLVSQKRQLVNLAENIKQQDKSVEQAQAFYRVGRGTKVDAFRAEQSYFNAQNNLLDTRQAFELALDRFKIQLGLPINVELDVSDRLPTSMREVDVSVTSAVTAALNNRLDLRTIRDQLVDQERQVVIRRNALLPQLNLVVSYDTVSDPAQSFRSNRFDDDLATASLNLELPLDRRSARNAYRSAQINLDRARRNLDQFEDNLILEIRNSVRALRQRRSQIEIESQNIESLKKRVQLAELENRQGSATNRDVVEARDELTSAENDQLGRYVDYEITRLTLLSQMGVLFVAEDGLIVEDDISGNDESASASDSEPASELVPQGSADGKNSATEEEPSDGTKTP